MNFALKVAQRIKIQNRKLVVAWIAMLSAIMAAGALGYNWKDADGPLIFGAETCTHLHRTVEDRDVWICQQGKKEYLVIH